MADIVEALRAMARGEGTMTSLYLTEWADEIDRLRATVEDLTKALEDTKVNVTGRSTRVAIIRVIDAALARAKGEK